MPNKRLLDYQDADRALAKTDLVTNFNVRHAFVMGAEAQDKLTRRETLKEIGDRFQLSEDGRWLYIDYEVFEALKRGEFPK